MMNYILIFNQPLRQRAEVITRHTCDFLSIREKKETNIKERKQNDGITDLLKSVSEHLISECTDSNSRYVLIMAIGNYTELLTMNAL